MAKLESHFLMPLQLLLLFTLSGSSFGTQYIVGDSIWTIPSTNYFYTNWSSLHSFQTGDTLLFDFDPELHNVMQVSRREYESCTANHPFQAFTDGPATIHLMEQGIYYFICSVADHCALGQKLSVIVHQNSYDSAPSSPPSSTSASQPLAPDDRPQTPSAATSPYASQAPNVIMDWSISLVGFASACEGCNGNVVGWFMSICLVLYFVFG